MKKVASVKLKIKWLRFQKKRSFFIYAMKFSYLLNDWFQIKLWHKVLLIFSRMPWKEKYSIVFSILNHSRFELLSVGIFYFVCIRRKLNLKWKNFLDVRHIPTFRLFPLSVPIFPKKITPNEISLIDTFSSRQSRFCISAVELWQFLLSMK